LPATIRTCAPTVGCVATKGSSASAGPTGTQLAALAKLAATATTVATNVLTKPLVSKQVPFARSRFDLDV
jgi:hypothetical protein